MFVSIMWIKIRTTLCFEKFWPSDLRAAAGDAVGVQAPLEIAKPPSSFRLGMLNIEQKATCFNAGGSGLHIHDPHRVLIL